METIKKQASSCFDDGKVFPPGFRFHPTDEELIMYYLKRKICGRRHLLDVIAETDVYKWHPEDLPETSKLKTGDRQWFFFSPRDRKYPNAARSNRATVHGYWKATGKDRIIKCNSRAVGVKKTLVFYHGRAPSGERTDWVMHEYTMDEDELRRCQYAKDYYALYKVFKKSGPGPKNGEQYSAPFREEDWSDEEIDANGLVREIEKQIEEEGVPSVNCPLQPQLDYLEEFMRSIADEPVPGGPSPADFVLSLDDLLLEGVPSVNNRVNCPLQPQLDDLEEFMRSIADDPVPGGPSPADFAFSLDDLLPEGVPSVNNKVNCPLQPQLDDLEEFIRSIADEPVPGGLSPADFAFSLDDLLPEEAQCNLKEETARGNEDPQVTSAVETHFPEPNLIEEDFFTDFLEMDDLIGSEPTGKIYGNPEQALENHFDEFDGLGEFDLFEDAAMLFCDRDSGDHGLVSPHYVNKWENDVANPASNYNLETNNANLQNGNSTFLHWSHDQQCTILFTPGPAQGTVSPTIPGLPYDGNSANPHTGADQNDGEKQDDSTDSWLSSVLWSFVESIPTSPASAAETALVNCSFDRMSSFSRVTINPRSSNVAGGVASATSSSSGKCTSGFFSFSVIGFLFAVMWMLIGMSMRVL